jgi:hypothetical protein
MSDRARPELALGEVEALVRHLGDELAGFRKRALAAESRLRDVEAAGGTSPSDLDQIATLRERVAELERENAALRGRLGEAAGRTRQMLDRVHFLRQQAQGGERTNGGER